MRSMLAASLLLTGCVPSPEPALLSYDCNFGDSCFVIAVPMVSGGATAKLNYPQTSSDQLVMAVDGTMVRSGKPGTVTLKTYRPEDERYVLPSTDAEVADPTSLRLEPVWPDPLPLLPTGSSWQIHGTPLRGDQALVGYGGVRFTNTGGLSQMPEDSYVPRSFGDGITLTATAAGPASLAVDSGALHQSFSFGVVDPSAATSIVLDPPSLHVSVGDPTQIQVTILADALPVSALCDWTPSDPSLTVGIFIPELDGISRDPVAPWSTSPWLVRAAKAGSFTSTCTVGNATAQLSVTAD